MTNIVDKLTVVALKRRKWH